MRRDEPIGVAPSVPEAVRVEGADLVFTWPADVQMLGERVYKEDVFPSPVFRQHFLGGGEPLLWAGSGMRTASRSRAMLPRFARLYERPDRDLATFAARYGPLEGDAFYLTPDAGGDSDAPTPAEMAQLLPTRQRLSWWRRRSVRAAEVLDIASGIGWPLWDPLSRRQEIEFRVNEFLLNGYVRPALLYDDLARATVTFVGVGLTAAIGLELLAAVATARLKLCQGCGQGVPPGSRIYCDNCRKAGVPARRRQERYRAKGGRGGQAR